MASRPAGTPISEGLIARVSRGVRYALNGDPTIFFGPGQPLPPQAQEVAGRQFDFPQAFNLQYRPRASDGTNIDFPTLRALADAYDIVRLCIETRKDQMGKLVWEIVRKDGGDVENDLMAKTIGAFFDMPDGEHDYETWQRMLLEDLMVLDAPCAYRHPTVGGQVFAWEPIDGATIKRVLTDSGRTPLPPDPAYQQVIKGLPAVDYHRDELVYLPRNVRTHKVYGYSPVEQILMIVNIGLRRQVMQSEYFTAGNIPDMLVETPVTWNPDQIKQLQTYFDEVLTGDTSKRRQIRFIPGGVKPYETKHEPLFDQFDEWLARVVCYCFSLPPTAFIKQMNRATAQSAQEAAIEEGLAPLMSWWERFMNRLIRLGWNTADYQFAWADEKSVDPLVSAQVDQIALGGPGTAWTTPQEVRDARGMGPAPAELDEANNPPPPPQLALPPGQQQPGDGTPPKGEPSPPGAQKLLAGGRSVHRRRHQAAY